MEVDPSAAKIVTTSKAGVSVATASLESKGVDAVVEATVKRGDRADTKRLAATEK